MKQIYKILKWNSIRMAIGIAAMFVLLASFAGALPNAYIANGENNVSVIDTASNTVIATVPVGISPNGVAVNPAGTKVYVANKLSDDVSVIDTLSNTVIATVPVGAGPIGVAVNPAGTKVYITNFGDNNVSVIDTTSNTVIATVPVGNGPYGVAVDPMGVKIYVANDFLSQTISVIDAVSNTVTATVNVGTDPKGVAVTPDGTKVYVTNHQDNTVSVIDTTSNTVMATVPVGKAPYGVAIDPMGTKAYVANEFAGQNTVSVIDTASNIVTATVSVRDPVGVAVTPDGTKVYVTRSNGNNVSVIDTVSNTVIATVNVGADPTSFGKFIGPILGSISGIKFNDLNGNGIRDSGEPTIANWSINLKDSSGNPIAIVNTDNNGNYIFPNLQPGTYIVDEGITGGWITTNPLSGSYTVTVGGDITGKDFGNFRLGFISGKKFNDLNGNGILDPGEPGLVGWVITLTSPDGSTQNITTYTNGSFDGIYFFGGLTAGNYTINETPQSGWLQTKPSTGSYKVTISSGSIIGNVSTDELGFGNFRLGEIHGTKFEDLNANDIKDTGEAGLQGWQININGTDTITNTLVNKTTTTDINGDYNFTGLTAGTYTISETLINGWVQTAPSTGKYTTNITSGSIIKGQDFGNFHKGKITGGGYISVKGDPKATFGLVGQYPDSKSGVQGNVEYQDHATGLIIKSTEIDSVATTLDKTKGVITGKTMINKDGPYPFVVYVEDNGEPGKGVDMFNISVASPIPYTNGAILSSGNIKIHQ